MAGDDLDETACDRCGCATPRLTPEADREFCDTCWVQVREENERIVGTHIRAYLEDRDTRTDVG